MSREDIWRHMDAGTCWLCEQPVVDGQACNGATGGHWDCEEKLDQEVRRFAPKGEIVLAVKACGSIRAHWVNTATHVALCGDAPKNTSKTMKPRGKWIRLRQQEPEKHEDMCPKCSAMYAAANH